MGFKRCGDSCGLFCSKDGQARLNCSCSVCAGLEGIDLSLAEACHKACNAAPEARPTSQNDFLCSSMTGEDLFTRFHIIRCGFDPEQSTTRLQQKEAQAKIDKENTPLKMIIYALIIVVMGGIAYLIFGNTQNANNE